MIVGGLQRFSLLDYPKEMSAIVFTQGCNFRCPYCHNPELVLPSQYREPIPEEEVLRFLKSRIGKLSAVVITGGEPTLQEGLCDFLRKVKELGFKIKLDTNGSRPEVLAKLIQARLIDYFAMDLKAPLNNYPAMCNAELNPSDILRSMELIRLSGVEYEFRTTVMPEILSSNSLEEIRSLLKAGDKYYLQPCSYSTTLDGLEPVEFGVQDWHKSGKYQDLHIWAEENRVSLELRG
ncbi:MAG TPA: anaerobic ribonucleoside-triphosphate reductase activating protein [Candidatus Cloacimonetes bacterium]|nr:anaerobic ribonucleoside-triphosphate reductase activating protein [Candidatus Cloacimonadota bacterium]